MNFVFNFLEDCEEFLLKAILEKENKRILEERNKLFTLKSSLDYRRSDIIYLVQKGFQYDKLKDLWYKEEDINYGKYPGKYLISLKFPENYPQGHPIITCKPLFSGKRGRKYSEHIFDRDYKVCISKNMHGSPNSYWQSNMNAKGALILTYHLITDEIVKKAPVSRKEIPIKGTIFESIEKEIKKKEFVDEFCKQQNIKVDNTWKWGEIAYMVSSKSIKVKKDLVKYYNDKTKSNTSKGKRRNKSKEKKLS